MDSSMNQEINIPELLIKRTILELTRLKALAIVLNNKKEVNKIENLIEDWKVFQQTFIIKNSTTPKE